MFNSNIGKTVYFVRHGQSIGNVTPVFQSPESPLNDKGIRQADSVADRVSRLSFEALIASPFQRAKETAEVISKITNKKIEFSDLFIERVKPSSVNGKWYEDEKADETWRNWKKSLYSTDFRVEDGENFTDLMERADKALEFLKSRPEKTLVVVTHGFFLRTVIARVLLGNLLNGEILKSFQSHAEHENTGITVLCYQEESEKDLDWRLWVYNDHSHLG